MPCLKMTERAGRQGSWFHGLAVIGPSCVHFPGGETVSQGSQKSPRLTMTQSTRLSSLHLCWGIGMELELELGNCGWQEPCCG